MPAGGERPIHTIPDHDFQFIMDIRGSDELRWKDFTRQRPMMLRERERLTTENPSVTIQYTEEAIPIIRDARVFFRMDPGSGGREDLIDLGVRFEHDLVLMQRGTEDVEPRMVAGVVCFPSAWRPEQKIGQPISAIHSPVPTLNSAIGKNIAKALNGLRDDRPFDRWGWGMTATDILNLHPDQEYPRISAGMGIDDLYIRWEHQGFQALEACNGLIFLIQIHLQPIREIASNPQQRNALLRQLSTMDRAIADYKGITPVLDMLLSSL